MNFLNEKIFSSNTDIPVKCSEKYGKVTADWHMHKEIEVVAVTAGYETYNFIDGSACLEKGDIIVVASNVPHYTVQPANCRTGIINIQFDKSFITSEMGDLIYSFPFLSGKEFFVLKNTEVYKTEKFFQMLQNVSNEFSKKEIGYKTVIKSELSRFVTLIIREGDFYSENHIKTATQKNFESVIEYIERCYDRKITLEDLSEKAGYSYNFFCKFFKEHTGMSFVDYLNGVRIKNAKNLLLTTDDTVTDICLKTGFSSLSYFNRVFKNLNGITPTEYRKKEKIRAKNAIL